MIDNNLNEKKKQPKFVIEGKYKLDEVKWVEKLPADWMFMETCRHSVCIRTVSCLLSKTNVGTPFFSKPLLITPDLDQGFYCLNTYTVHTDMADVIQ